MNDGEGTVEDDARAEVDSDAQDDLDSARELTRAVNNLTRVVTNLDELLRRDYPKRAEIERRFVSKQSSRRQALQFVVIILIIAMLGVYFNVQMKRQQECFEGKLAEATDTSSQRATLNEQESAQNRALWDIYAEAAGLIKDPANPELDQKDQERLNAELVAQLLEYQRVVGGIEKKREKLPVEPYEAGSC